MDQTLTVVWTWKILNLRSLKFLSIIIQNLLPISREMHGASYIKYTRKGVIHILVGHTNYEQRSLKIIKVTYMKYKIIKIS
jgi:hypothetical protein